MQGWGIVFAATTYLLFLFVVASYGDRRLRHGRAHRSRPAIYALSLAIYCTSWTFFGSVGLAATSGLDFLAIYVGPILMITVGFPLFSHIIAVAKRERITSIADFIASRYGKSTVVGAVAAVIAVLGTVPYIALQLKAISTLVSSMITQYQPSVLGETGAPIETSFVISVLLAMFAILFGTRHADATEHQGGLMLAVATESIVKLVAFLVVGLFVTFYLFDGMGDIIAKSQASAYVTSNFLGGINPSKFAVFTLLSFCAFVLLPRQFHVGVVENHSPEETKAARWMFPLYLVLINLFVIPVALAGMLTFGSSIDADSYVLALPLDSEANFVSLVVFVGGLSAATAMVIVACVALAIMISNNLILPLILRNAEGRRSRDMAPLLLNIRRTAIFIILALAYGYFQTAQDSAALASIGLLSFAAVAQFAPAFFIGMFWRRANARGAVWGMVSGFAVWFYTLFLPTVVDDSASLLLSGPFGVEWLHPQALFWIDADPLNHGVFFSLLINTLSLVVASLSRQSKAIERMQANAFWVRGRRVNIDLHRDGRAVTVAELKNTVSNYLGRERCNRSFNRFYSERGADIADEDDLADDTVILFAEQVLASAIGAASSRLVMSLLLQKHDSAEQKTIQLLDDASEALQFNRDLLQTALDQVEQGISVFDNEFRLSSWNRQFRVLLNLPPELGQAGIPLTAVAEAIVVENNPPTSTSSDLTKQLLEIDEPFILTLAETGRIVEVQTKSVPDGGVVISWSDVTEKATAAQTLQVANETLERRVQERTEELTQLNEDLARAREAAETANIGKTRFLAAVGHDILQPLNAARLYTSSLVEQLSGDPTIKLAGNVDSALESVEDILGSVLAISRLDAGALNPNVTIFSVERLFKQLEVEFRPMADLAKLKLDIISNDLHVRSDYNLLRRLLQNLISNAIKYTENGSVTVDAVVQKNGLEFSVRDTGQGIEEKDRTTIFEEFKRLEAGKLLAPGLGLGLSIVNRLAATLEHELTFETAPGEGSTFRVITPLAIPSVQQLNTGRKKASQTFDLAGIQIICVDNEPRILDGMRQLLSGWGCTVEIFEDSNSLLTNLPNLNPDIILADYHLDHENGLEVIAAARAKVDINLPAVLITADRSAAVRDAAEQLEVTLLNKPLKPASLRAVLTRTMISRGAAPNVAAE